MAFTHVRRTATTLAFLPIALEAQQLCAPDEVTKWWPRRYAEGPPIARDERSIIESNLGAVEALVGRTTYGTPRGFAVRPDWHRGASSNRNQLRSYEFAAMTFRRCNPNDEHGSDFVVIFNPNPQRWSERDRPMLDENGESLFIERVRSEPSLGATRAFGYFQKENTEGLFLLFTAGGESPTVPATREEYLQARIFNLEGKDQARVKEAIAHASKTQYQRWLEGATDRKKRNEQIVAGIASTDPAQAEKTRASLENAEREAGETLKKIEPQEREELARIRAQTTLEGDKLRAQIAAMTPAERASPAWILGVDLVEPGSPNANAVLRLNREFYRASTSPVEVRAILVRIPNTYKERMAQHQHLYREFDWEALKRLIRN